VFPDLYELGMSNFGLKILYQIVNAEERFMADRAYAPNTDMEKLLRERNIPLWGWESRRPLFDYELVGFSLQYELTYTNVLNMLELAHLPVRAKERTALFPLIFGGGPSAVNPEPMAAFMDFFIIGDGERAVPHMMHVVGEFKEQYRDGSDDPVVRQKLLARLATEVPGVYVPAFYEVRKGSPTPKPKDISHLLEKSDISLPERVFRQTVPLDDSNQPTNNLVPYLSLVHDREVLEVRRGCDRGCRFCQPGYTFLPVRERSADDLLRLSKEAMAKSGHQEYSMLSLCVSDYTSLQESVRALNEEHSARRSSLSFPSQRADRMNLELAEELQSVRRSGITLAPEAGTERLRAVINKGLSHQQIISAIEAAYQSGWISIKLYFMCCLPTERDEDLVGIIEVLKEATNHCRVIKKTNPAKYRRDIEFTCTISNFVPKPFTPFQWFGPVDPAETTRKHQVLKAALRESRLRNVQLNVTAPQISLLESAIGRGDRITSELIYDAWRAGCTFDAWDDRLQPAKWHEVAAKRGLSLEQLGCQQREVGCEQPWDVIHIGLNTWWLVKEWQKAMTELETPPCTENLCHACGVCTELETTHLLAKAKAEVIKRNPFVKELSANTNDEDHHPSLFFQKPEAPPSENQGTCTRIRFILRKTADLRFISHLDLQSLITRAARRAFLNVAYTKGFNPQPKFALAAALPLFQQSEGEVGEIELAEKIDEEQFRVRLNRQLPDEVQIVNARILPEKSSSLASVLHAARYRATIVRLDGAFESADPETLSAKVQGYVEKMLASETLLVQVPEKDGAAKPEPSHRDIRSGIFSLRMTDKSPVTLEFDLAHGSKMHVKPGELLSFLQPPELVPVQSIIWRITRLDLMAADGMALFDA
jgi:radical SAM family uncharacterized protein/radical SAM-linked protein